MSPARVSPPAVRAVRIGRASQPPSAPAPPPSLPWAGDATLGYIPVGYKNAPTYTGAALIDGTGITVASNTTYVGYTNLGNGAIGTFTSPVSNVTCIGCEFNAGGTPSAACVVAGSNVTFKYCTFQPTGALAGTVTKANVTQATGYQFAVVADGTQASPGTFNSFCRPMSVDHCEMWGFSNAGKVAEGTQTAVHSFYYNWVNTPRPNTDGTDHTDGLGCPGGGGESYAYYRGNNVQGNGDTQAIAYQGTPFDHCVFDTNLFGGYGFTFNLGSGVTASVTNNTFTNNTYSTQYQTFFGPLYDNGWPGVNGNVWHNNKWLVPQGAFWGHQQYNGYFWIPGFTSTASPSLDELSAGLVSLTDF